MQSTFSERASNFQVMQFAAHSGRAGVHKRLIWPVRVRGNNQAPGYKGLRTVIGGRVTSRLIAK
jgi:hypothetical protein